VTVVSAPNADTERLYWPAEKIRDWQLTKLRETLAQAARSPYYGPRLKGTRIESLDDLARLPLTPKADVRDNSPWGLVAVPREELYEYHESTGTTGVPSSSWMSCSDLDNFATQINHSDANLRPGDRVLVRQPYAISVPGHIITRAAHNRGACIIPASSQTIFTPYRRVIDLMRKLDATIFGSLPMEAIWIAEMARIMGLNPAKDFPHLRAILTSGELLTDVRRARIEQLWNVKLFNLYGCTEAGNIAADCEHGRLHLSWDHFLLEILDETTNQPLPPGQLGLARVTTLTRQAMPLLRFELGDYLRLRYDHKCPCGRTSPVLEHYGREINLFHFGGQRFFLRDLEDRLLKAPLEALSNFWLIEVRPDVVAFRVEAEKPDAALYRRLERQCQSELGLKLRIETVAPGELLDRGRFTWVGQFKKPSVIGYAEQKGKTGLTLDDLMPAPLPKGAKP
jgi:phenylacetate-CoA ligase